MIKFEKIEEIEEAIDETKPYLDKILGKMVYRLKSNIRCVFDPAYDNGNHTISDLLAEHVKEEKVFVCDTVLEYRPGYGSIGFDMLGLGATNRVVFVDTDENSVLTCLETAKNNSVLFYTTGYAIDSIGDLPEQDKYDVIIATLDGKPERYQDFFEHIHKFMSLYADIYLVEDEDVPELKMSSPSIILSNVYFVDSIKLADKTLLHYKLCHK